MHNWSCFACLLALCVVAARGNEIYKWIDAQGRVHYSQSLPDGAPVQVVPIQPSLAPVPPQTRQPRQASGPPAEVAADASPVGMLNILGAIPVQASYGMQAVPVLQPAVRNAYQDLAQQRQRKYMQEHAEQAALNSPQGLVPFARVPEIRE